MEKYFGGWEKGNVPTAEYPTPTAPEGTHVAFVDKPGAVQSTISIVYPVDLKPGSTDAIAASVMNAILGNGGFMARLIQNIREDKAYTYGAYSSLSTDPLVGDFYAGAEVRNEVTDSAIVQFFYEMNRLATEKVSEEELQNIKNYMNGGFARSLERPQTVARFALNTARYNLPADFYATYLEKLQAVTADDILAVAKKYLRPQNAYLVVVGNKDEVAKKLEVFASDGKVHFYDAYGNPVSDAQPIPAGVTAEMVVQNYMTAIGASSEKLAKLTTQDVTMKASMQGMPIEIRKVTSGSNQLMMTITSGEMVFQKVVINGETGKVSGMMGAKDLSKEEVAEYLKATTLVEESNFSSKSLSLVHIEEMDGHQVYKMEVKDGEETSYHYYDVSNGLKWAKIETAETPQGPMVSTTKYADYKEVNGIQYPHSVVEDNGGQVMELQVSKITLGSKVDSNNFKL
jgi:hypothetical protein